MILNGLIFFFAAAKASLFSEYMLAEGERVLFAKTATETIIDPPEVITTFPLPLDPKKLPQVAIDNGASRHKSRNIETIRLEANGAWTKFHFWEAGAASKQVFQFKINRPHLLDVTDFMCSGDSFSVLSVDSLRGNEIIATTLGKGAFDNCLTFAATPQQAWNSENFSHVRHLLEAGTYQLQIVANKSPAGAGQGAIRLEPVRLARKTRRNFQLVESKLPFRHAAHVCDMFGMDLAQIDNQEEAISAFKLVHDTLGPRETAFIAGFQGARTAARVEEFSEEGLPSRDDLVDENPYYLYSGKHRGTGQILTSSTPYPPSSVICKIIEHDT